MTENLTKWFHNWFNSPYYHILYSDRDDNEAEYFIDNLCAYLTPKNQANILDIGCGRGRHAIYLNKKGYTVTGIDLSNENIQVARNYENKKLKFWVKDMRNPLSVETYDFAFNLFTSFGFFETDEENQLCINNFSTSLASGGTLVIDFMNSEYLEKNLVVKEIKQIKKYEFHISRKLEDDHFIKMIQFEDKGKHYNFREEVKALRKKDFERYFAIAGLSIRGIFGNYNLDEFIPKESDRMIFICDKL